MDVKDGIKNIFFAGIGAAAIVVEKTGEVADTLINKGAEAVEKGKAINQELKHKAAEYHAEKKDISSFVKNLSPEEKEQLKKELNAEEDTDCEGE